MVYTQSSVSSLSSRPTCAPLRRRQTVARPDGQRRGMHVRAVQLSPEVFQCMRLGMGYGSIVGLATGVTEVVAGLRPPQQMQQKGAVMQAIFGRMVQGLVPGACVGITQGLLTTAGQLSPQSSALVAAAVGTAVLRAMNNKPR